MPKRSSKGEPGNVHRAAVTLGSRGSAKGGPARAIALNQQERKAIAKKGGRAKAKKQA